MDLGKVALGGLIDRLEDRGFVERKADESDRRINRVFLTRKGNQVLDRMAKIGMDMNAKVMRGISLERQHMLAVTLHEMKENLIALDTVPGSKSKRAEGYGDISILIPLSDFSVASKELTYVTAKDPTKFQVRIKYADSVNAANNYARTKQWTFGIEALK